MIKPGLATVVWVHLLSSIGCQDISSGGNTDRKVLQGQWEAVLTQESSPQGITIKKGRITFDDDHYTYGWYRRLTDSGGRTILDWSLTSRETGRVNFADGKMKWTVNAKGRAQFDGKTKRWQPIEMAPAEGNYEIVYQLMQKQLIIKEDYNLDGDFDDVEPIPETLTYLRVRRLFHP